MAISDRDSVKNSSSCCSCGTCMSAFWQLLMFGAVLLIYFSTVLINNCPAEEAFIRTDLKWHKTILEMIKMYW